MKIFIFLVLFALSAAITRSGNYNTFYQIPYSTGERIREWDSKEVILNDEPSLIYWSYNFNVDFKNNLWIAD